VFWGKNHFQGKPARFLTTPTPPPSGCVCVGGGGARVFNKPLDMLNAKGRNLSEFLSKREEEKKKPLQERF